jgi:hypothetical protein
MGFIVPFESILGCEAPSCTGTTFDQALEWSCVPVHVSPRGSCHNLSLLCCWKGEERKFLWISDGVDLLPVAFSLKRLTVATPQVLADHFSIGVQRYILGLYGRHRCLQQKRSLLGQSASSYYG